MSVCWQPRTNPSAFFFDCLHYLTSSTLSNFGKNHRLLSKYILDLSGWDDQPATKQKPVDPSSPFLPPLPGNFFEPPSS